MSACPHHDQEHTVWYWLDDGGIPVPYAFNVDNHAHAMAWVRDAIRAQSPVLQWIKVFRSDNEFYTCYAWDAEKDARV